jgi:o-succinylbenzoate---CoA ligase
VTSPPSPHPVQGSPREVEQLLQGWLLEDAPPALTVRTSGSTGGPKDVALSAAAVRASAAATLRRLGGPGQWVLALPARYVAGLQVITRSVLAETSPVVLDDHADLTDATAALTGERRYLAIVPTQLHRWMQIDTDVKALTQYDAVLMGGSAPRTALLDEALERGVQVVTTYGMSETCGGCVYDGWPLDGVAVALGSGGEVRIAGPVLFDGYVDRPDLTAEVLQDGWLRTPDLGRFDTDGKLVVLGRADEVVISGGVNVALPVVEARLAQMRGVDQVAVTSRPDPEWGATVVALVVSQHPPGLDAVRDFVAETHPRSWAPRGLVVVDALPLLESGKVDRQTLPLLLDSSDSASLTSQAAGRTNHDD